MSSFCRPAHGTPSPRRWPSAFPLRAALTRSSPAAPRLLKRPASVDSSPSCRRWHRFTRRSGRGVRTPQRGKGPRPSRKFISGSRLLGRQLYHWRWDSIPGTRRVSEGGGRRECARHRRLHPFYSCVLRYGFVVRSLTLLAGCPTKEDSDMTDTRIATDTMKAFVFKKIGEVDVVKKPIP